MWISEKFTGTFWPQQKSRGNCDGESTPCAQAYCISNVNCSLPSVAVIKNYMLQCKSN